MSHEPNEPSKNDNEHVQQQLIHAALDSALEDLDSDNDDDDEEENETFSDCISNEHEIHHIIQPKAVHHERPSNVNSIAAAASQPILGPPKPPPPPLTPMDDTNAQMDQLFASMMGQLMNMNDDNDGDNNNTNRTPLDPLVADVLSNMNEDEVLGRFMQEIQSRLQSELTSAALSTSNNNNHSNKSKQMNRPTTTAPTKSSTATRSVSSITTPPLAQPTSDSNNHNNNSNEVESVISNLVSNLSQTMNRSLNDDDDDDISELDDLPDMDQMDDNHNNDEDDMAILLQKLMGNLMNHNSSSNKNTTNADHNDTTTTSADRNADSILDGMMEQLLCKDIMYEPMKQVASKFPHWLQEQQSTLSATEYERRRQQNDCFQKIVQTYETEPVNMKQLIALMQEVQEYGQPPSDIIQAIAPGIALDDNGVPIMNATGGTTFPPFGGTNHNDDDCCIM